MKKILALIAAVVVAYGCDCNCNTAKAEEELPPEELPPVVMREFPQSGFPTAVRMVDSQYGVVCYYWNWWGFGACFAIPAGSLLVPGAELRRTTSVPLPGRSNE